MMNVNLNNTDNNDYVRGFKDGKIAGATATHDRAKVLVDALKEFISYHETGLLPARHVYEKGVAALEQWEGKEVQAECTCSLSRIVTHGRCYKCPELTNPQQSK